MIPHLALAVISAAVLGYEVLLVRLFAIVQWHHFAFMAISIALLGFGISGTVLAIWQDWAKTRFTRLFAANAVLFSITAPVSFLLVQALPFNALAVVWEPGQLLYLPAMYLLLVVPFFCGAICIGLSFVRFGHEAGHVYAFNLIGSAAGAFGIVAVLFVIAPLDGLKLVATLGLLSAAIIALAERSVIRTGILAACGSLALAMWFVLQAPLFTLKISEFKGLPAALQVTGSKLLDERSSPLGLLTVVASPKVPFRYVPGLSLNVPDVPPDQLGIFADGGSMSPLTRFDGERERLSYLDYTTDALAYQFTEQPSVLVLGAGGGAGVLQAIYHQASEIDAVELDANMVRIVQGDYATVTGGIYSRNEVRVHIAEARGFVGSTRRQWDIIQIPLLDASGGGLHGLSETYVYTAEAFSEYLDRLRPGGWLGITCWLKLPPRDTLKLFATAVDALRRAGVGAPGKQLMLIRGLNTATLLVKNGTISDEEIERARTFAKTRSFDLSYHPKIGAGEVNRYNVLETPYFHQGAMALIGADSDGFITRYKFDIRPASDERPYFSNFLKWRHLPELLAAQRSGGAGLLELGSLILAGTLVQAAILSAALILAPLWVRRRQRAGAGRLWRVAGYFLALGLAFLFIEIAFIQKFVLFLGHPIYAVAVVLTGFLLFAGIGSGLSSPIARRIDAWHEAHPQRMPSLSAIQLAVAGIVTVSLVYLLILPAVFSALVVLGDAGKILVSLALIAPLAIFMGMPFPLGLSRVWSAAPALVPWAWGVNGCASVLSALLATLTAMSFGFSVVIAMAAVLYICAAIVFSRPL